MAKTLRSDHIDEIEEWNLEDASELKLPGDKKKYSIVVSSRDWTVQTIVQQIREGNIELEPAFQRRNAWKDARRSKLIESFILGFPVPQIVLAENPRARGKFIVIDGKQRLLTIAGFYLKEYRDYWTQSRFSGLDILKPLNLLPLDEFLDSPKFATERRQLGNADIRTTVITGFSDEGVLYNIFYRINTGSVPLSSQELRQVLNRGEFSKYLIQRTTEQNELWDVLRISAPDPRLRDVELLLRLIAWRMFASGYKGNMKPFLDDAMGQLNNRWPKERAKIQTLVDEIFAGIGATIQIFGEDAGRKISEGQFETSLNRALFEVQAFYLSFLPLRRLAVKKKKEVQSGFRRLSEDREFITSIETTTKSIDNLRIRFNKFRLMLERELATNIEPTQIGK